MCQCTATYYRSEWFHFVGFFFISVFNLVTDQEKRIIYIMFTSYNSTLILSKCKSLGLVFVIPPTPQLVVYLFVVVQEDSDCSEQNTGGGMRGSLLKSKKCTTCPHFTNLTQYHWKTTLVPVFQALHALLFPWFLSMAASSKNRKKTFKSSRVLALRFRTTTVKVK